MSTTLSAQYQPNLTSDALKSLSFDACDAPKTLNDHLRLLRTCSTRHHFTRNETIFNEGQPANQIYKIISGTVRICRYLPDGRRHVLDFALAGDVMGFVECADQPASAEAATTTTLISYPRQAFDKLAAANPAVRAQVFSLLSSDLLDAQERLTMLGCQTAKERLASFLLRFAERSDILPGEALDLPMSRQDIADHLGLTSETICRTLTSLKSDGIVSAPNAHQLIFTNKAALRALCVQN